MRWCWHPEAAVRAGRGTGLGSAWLALHSAAAPAAAGADWPARALHTLRGAACRSFQQRQSGKSRNQTKPCSGMKLLQASSIRFVVASYMNLGSLLLTESSMAVVVNLLTRVKNKTMPSAVRKLDLSSTSSERGKALPG